VTHKKVKGLKPWLFKSVAVFIGICYLMAPLQHEITDVMHFLSHAMDQGVGQPSIAAHTHSEVAVEHSLSTTKVHKHNKEKEGSMGPHGHDHSHISDMHQHEIIDFMTMAFSASTPNHEDKEQIAVQSGLDKHLVLEGYIITKPVQCFKKLYFSNIIENTFKGIQHPMVPPPKSLS
jgi:hypothetical protein